MTRLGVAAAGENKLGGSALSSSAGSRALAGRKGEDALLATVRERCHVVMGKACQYSSIPVGFLAALVANESGGNAQARRFEPAVYRHLKRLAEGHSSRYGGISVLGLERELGDMLRPKADAFHAVQLSESFATANSPEIAALHDEALRELATSWGYTQIMGYHMVGRTGTVRDLLEPHFHFRLALELLAQFIERYQLDPRCEFAEMFRCWNTGRPYGETTDPRYVEKGLRRMEIYRAIE